MTERQIELANHILSFLGPHSDWKAEEDIERHLNWMADRDEIRMVAKSLIAEDLLEWKDDSANISRLAATFGPDVMKYSTPKFGYELTIKAVQLLSKGKNFRDYWKEKAEKEDVEKAKAEQDEHYKKLQIRDLEEKLSVMNVEQRAFWNEQKARNKQLTLIAIIGALFSLFALLKAWGFLS